MSDSKYEVSQAEHGVPAKRGKKRACADHCKRFWWLHVLIFCCVVVLVVCLIIFVGVPKIAQSKLNEAELQIQGVNVLQTKPDSFLMEINSTITTDGKIHADVDAFEGTMSLDADNAKPFVTLQFPKTTADKFQTVNISQTVQIKDMEAFKEFNVAFFQQEKLRVRVQGKTRVQPKGLDRKYDVDFKKTLDINGLNLFKGTKVTDGTVDIMATKGKPNFRGTAEIPNNSHFTLDIGNATFTNFADGQNLGNLTIRNLLVRPGINKVDIEAELDQVKVLSIVSKKPYCDNGVVPFQLLGTDVENGGQKLDYFTATLASANQTVDIDIGSILKKTIKGFQVSCSSS
ncbi:hypothetical protein HRG_002666 [Hirsutella rhossiliensis]|uniref:Uncharacterized protein n=1 Tax=Hirsutella rhossiliensis TaxID=111463 RepID=A0A9P8N9U5_9HYPO|nr:uncharacterized protein HRG_02666 [Hirsutella rhossiliensis]KAH0967257.1 hypothetical protein HRG_02666 [Hirsutella rhossiliensis]